MNNIFTKYKKAIFIVGFLIFFLNLGGFTGIHNFYHRFIFTGIITIPFTFFLLKINPYKNVGILLIFAYFFVSTPVIIYSLINGEKIPGVISYSLYIIASVFAILIYKSKLKWRYILLYCIIFIFYLYNHNNTLNWYRDMYEDKVNIDKMLPEIVVHDYQGNKTVIKPNGKVQVVDLWSTSCGYCIQSFPEFEKVYQKYKNDNQVMVYAINAKIRDFNLERANRYVKKYPFPNYFADSIILKKLNYSAFPYYMIVSKKGEIKYFGSLHILPTETYNNFYDLIENEKKSSL